MYHILLVEDDEDLSEITKVHLASTGHQVDQAYTYVSAAEKIAGESYDLIILDMMLPDGSGAELCRAVRSSCDCPIIFLSCLDDSDTIINALKSGGDDYMVKPVRYGELLARAEAIIRRAHPHKVVTGHLRRFRSFDLDTERHLVVREGEETSLSSIEFTILMYMADHSDKLLLYKELYENVWGSDSLGDYRTVMVHISNLRKKIDPDHLGILQTVRGAGYIFSDQ